MNLSIIDDILNGEQIVITESIENYYEIQPLLEAAQELMSAEITATKASVTKDPAKANNIADILVDKIKDVIKWFYKLEPDKKCESLSRVLRVLIKSTFTILVIAGLICTIPAPIPTSALSVGIAGAAKSVESGINNTNKDTSNMSAKEKLAKMAKDKISKTKAMMNKDAIKTTLSPSNLKSSIINKVKTTISSVYSLFNSLETKLITNLSKADFNTNKEILSSTIQRLNDKLKDDKLDPVCKSEIKRLLDRCHRTLDDFNRYADKIN
jgi:hypothetical protein